MDDAPSAGCRASRGIFTAGTASAVTKQSDLGKADFYASDTGVISYPDLTLLYTSRGRSGYEINKGVDGRWVCHTCACLSSVSLFLGQGLDLLNPLLP